MYRTVSNLADQEVIPRRSIESRLFSEVLFSSVDALLNVCLHPCDFSRLTVRPHSAHRIIELQQKFKICAGCPDNHLDVPWRNQIEVLHFSVHRGGLHVFAISSFIQLIVKIESSSFSHILAYIFVPPFSISCFFSSASISRRFQFMVYSSLRIFLLLGWDPF